MRRIRPKHASASRYSRGDRAVCRQNAGMPRPRGASGRLRRGVEILELILALPVMLIASLAVLEFGILVLVQQAVTTAATEGAREAAKGATCTEVGEVVEAFLAAHNLDISGGGSVKVVCESKAGGVTTTASAGNASLDCSPPGFGLNNGEVRVTVCVEVTDGNDKPVPDWLSVFGFSLAGATFEVSSLAQFE